MTCLDIYILTYEKGQSIRSNGTGKQSSRNNIHWIMWDTRHILQSDKREKDLRCKSVEVQYEYGITELSMRIEV